VAAAADGASAAGYTFVRVFIDAGTPQRSDGINGPYASAEPLSRPYLANVAAFVATFASRGVYTMATLNGLPSNAFWDARAGAAPAWCEYPHCDTMAPSFVSAFAFFAASFVSTLEADHGLDPNGLLAVSLANEAFVLTSSLPFSRVDGVVYTGDGGSYDMANATRRQACADNNFVHWASVVTAAIRAASPGVLVAVGVFTPQAVCKPGFIGIVPVPGCSDERYPQRPRALAHAAPVSVDFVDLHVYPFGHVVGGPRSAGVSAAAPDWSLGADLGTAEWDEIDRARAPVLMAETGAFKDFYSSAADAAVEIADLAHRACQLGFKGVGEWTWDTHEQSGRIWTMLDDGGAIRDALAPRHWADLCEPPPALHRVLPLGLPASTTSASLSDPPLLGDAGAPLYLSGEGWVARSG